MNSDQLAVNSQESPPASDSSPHEDKQEAQGKSEALETPSSLRDTPPLQGENLDAPKLEAPDQVRVDSSSATLKTQGVRVSRGIGAEVLAPVAERAVRSGRRNDVHEYMRLRRSYV